MSICTCIGIELEIEEASYIDLFLNGGVWVVEVYGGGGINLLSKVSWWRKKRRSCFSWTCYPFYWRKILGSPSSMGSSGLPFSSSEIVA